MESSHPAHGWRRTLASQLLGNFAAGCCPFRRHHKPNKISNEWCFHGKRALKAYTPGKPNKNKSVQVWGKNRRKISSRLQPHSSATAQLPHSLPSEWTLDWIWVNPNKPGFFHFEVKKYDPRNSSHSFLLNSLRPSVVSCALSKTLM